MPIWRRRQATEALLLQRVLTYYPAEAIAKAPGASAAAHPPMHEVPGKFRTSLTVFRIFDIDQRSQTFAMHYRMRLMWRDCRLLHNCSWLSMTEKHPLYRSLWTPPWKIEEEEGNEGDMTRGMLAFSPEGEVFLAEERVGRFRCDFDFRGMPFDKQTCHVTLLLLEDGGYVDLQLLPGDGGELVFVENVANAEWLIGEQEQWTASNMSVQREMYNAKVQMKAVQWSFPLDRRPRSMLMNFLFPAIMFYLVSWLGLWIDPAAVPARAAVGVIPVLIMTNKLSSLGAAIPPISYPVRLESFLIATLTFIVMQMLEFGFVNYGMRRARAAREHHEEAVVEEHHDEIIHSPSFAARRAAARIAHSSGRAAKALAVPDRIAIAFGNFTDMHFRWVSMVAYAITSLSILLS